MEDKDILFRQLLQKITELEEKIEQVQIKSNDRTKERVNLKMVAQILMRAFIVAIITFSVGMLILTFSKKNVESPKTINTGGAGAIQQDTVVKHLPSVVIEQNESLALKNKMDSLQKLFIEEVSGTGESNKAGYGVRAQALKFQIDSLKNRLEQGK